MFRGIDSTFGAGDLIKIAQERYNNLSEEEQFYSFQLCEKFKKGLNGDCQLINLLCQYNAKTSLEFGDMLWYRKIQEMIINGTLYMALCEIPRYAFRDNEFDNNCKNLEHLGVNVYIPKSKGCSDGLWEMNKPKIYQSDEETPDDIESIQIENPFGVVEFGTQKICKSAMTLWRNEILLRVPYQLEYFEKPVCAFFVNTKPHSDYFDNL